MKRRESSFGKAFLLKKRFALVEIALVLCSVFLVALPGVGIATDQNQEMQKASASAYTPKPFIYGDATEDGTVDMGDVVYIKLTIFGKKDKTTLADAKYDDRINVLDVIQTKLIILGKEKQLTFIDLADRIVTINKPIERIALADLLDSVTTLVPLGAEDKIVAIGTTIKNAGYERLIDPKPSSWWTPLQVAAPELKDLPEVGTWKEPNLEAIVSVEPDVVFGYCARGLDTPNTIQDKTGIPTLCVNDLGGSSWAKLDNLEIYRLVGEIMDKEERAEELISYLSEKIEEITEVTSEIPDSEKPRVYLAGWGALTRTPLHYDPLDIAGGINVAKGAGTDLFMVEVSKEQIIAWNPDIIVIHRVPTSKSHVWGNTIEDILTDPDLQTVNAVKNKRVYYTKGFAGGWDPPIGVTETFYMAKLFHPEKFEDMDVEREGNEILERFYGVDGLYTEIADRCEFYRWE